MNMEEAERPFDTVLRWDELKTRWDRIIRRRYLVALLVTMVLGLGLFTGLIGGPDPMFKQFGSALLIVGAGVGWSYLFRSRRAMPRHARHLHERKRSPVGLSVTIESAVSLPPNAGAFLDCIKGLTSAEWRTVVKAASGSWALEQPIDSSLNLLPIVLESHSWGSSPELRDATHERLALLLNSAVADHQKQQWVTEVRRLLDVMVDQEMLPFSPPFDEYRLAVNALMMILFADLSPEVCRKALEPFQSVLSTDVLDGACRGQVIS